MIEDKLMDVEVQTHQDASTLAHVRNEWDDLHQTAGRFHLEPEMARRERDIAQQQVASL